MSPSVLAGLAGVLVAAAATGLLARQCVRGPQAGIALWAAACLALVVALLAQIAGFATGFTPVTFRAAQLGAQFAAPLWLAWGLVEAAHFSGTARFAMRLTSGAITVVGGVIVGSDPLTAAPFSKSWPPAGAHFQFIANDAVLLTQGVAVLAALTAAGAASLRARAGPASAGSGQEISGYAAALVAVLATTGLRFAFPANSGYPLLCGLAAALAWFAMTRMLGTGSELSAAERGQRARRYESDDPANISPNEPTMRGWRGRNRDDWEEPRRDRRGGGGRRDDQGWYEPGPDNRGYPGEGYPDRGHDDRGYGYPGDARSAYQQPAYGGYEPNGYDQGGYATPDRGQAGYAPDGYAQNGYGADAYDGGGANGGAYDGGGANGGAYDGGGYNVGYNGAGANGGGYNGAGANGGGYNGAGANGGGYNGGGAYDGAGYGAAGYEGTSQGGAGYGSGGYERPNGASFSGPAGGGAGYGGAVQPDMPPAPAVSPGQMTPATPANRPYGRISIFTLLDDKAAEFDQLAEQTAEAVRVAEPDTLVYVIHLVPKAPMQRIFYEIYRDRDAFDLHERQPHNQRFAAERRPYVLATNIIELRLKFAKVAPLSPASSQKPQTQHYSQIPQTPQGQLPPPDPAPRSPAPNRGQPSPMGQRYGD
jgi:quinol monooxygenase YgiN